MRDGESFVLRAERERVEVFYHEAMIVLLAESPAIQPPVCCEILPITFRASVSCEGLAVYPQLHIADHHHDGTTKIVDFHGDVCQ